MTFEATRRKQILVLQPKGKALYEDDSSFGSKMLAKMGWSKGKGLGKEQHGKLDFIQIRYKNNANGLGYEALKDNQWTENENQFDNLLKTLNGAAGSNSNSADEQVPTGSKSLEEKSKLSRARVHYKKFTRGKDVHKYSEKELANILGKKTLSEVEEKPKETKEEDVDDKPSAYDSNLIVNTGLSVTDYFKQKMQSKAKLIQSDSDETSRRKKRGFSDETIEATETVEIEFTEKPKKKKKRKLSNHEEEVPVEVVQGVVEPVKKKKKSKKDRAVEEVDEAEEATQQEEETPKKAEKKKSKKNKVDVPEETITQMPESVEEEVKTKSKKSKKNREASPSPPPVPEISSKKSGEPDRPRGANAVYSTNVIQIPTHVAQKMSSMSIHNFTNANIANVVGYGLTEDIEIKTVQTKIGDNSNNTDKYSLYNMDKMARQKVNPRKIISKLKRTKKSIQVI